MLEQDRSDVAHQDEFLRFMFDSNDGINHADVLAHLEGGFGIVKL
jgi:hypothetical protein